MYDSQVNYMFYLRKANDAYKRAFQRPAEITSRAHTHTHTQKKSSIQSLVLDW